MKTSKLNSLVIGFTAATLILCFASTSLAQSQTMKATIPFDFYAGDKLLPGGVYTIRPSANGAIYIGNGSTGAFMLTNAVNMRDARNALVFTRYGDISFLTKLQWAGTSTGREVPPTKLEKEARLRMSPVQLAVSPK
jgi:hypothetical protein